MKRFLQHPNTYTWLVLFLLPVQAVLFMACLDAHNSASLAFNNRELEHLKHSILLGNRLMYTCLGLFVADIILLHVAVVLTRRGKAEEPSLAARPEPDATEKQ